MVELAQLFGSSICFFETKSELADSLRSIWSVYSDRLCVLTDENVGRLQRDFLTLLEPKVVVTLEPGENAKQFSKLERVYWTLLNADVDRTWFLLGVGGGAVCDIAGFIGSTFMRGLRFGFVPTTLLAMVDAAIGGKNGVDLGAFKNTIGTITLPEFVLLCPEFLSTLPAEEFKNGLAEVVKTGLIGDERLLEVLQELYRPGEEIKHSALREIITRSINVKVRVVSEDLGDRGLRRLLNFGHTVGHALELKFNLRHGFAVSVGMVVESRVNEVLFGTKFDVTSEIQRILATLGLPTYVELGESDIEEVLGIARHDKKNSGNYIDLVNILRPGVSEVRSVKRETFLEILRCILTEIPHQLPKAW
ncbi:3-dehydroquinate synthase [Fervidobacterium thailandense]|uniref:3-dehydroquinate synthase n=1 Tax=Fervidobacterium thailandense TaxID=1008305 RepID=A0A1E3G1J5_9BACT|nr:3-dehydroquinate synthase [Fervidobacterium thailandense]ODN30020.1 hypothetical protein A4H02_07525 [Fervidobacterium thailandense]